MRNTGVWVLDLTRLSTCLGASLTSLSVLSGKWEDQVFLMGMFGRLSEIMYVKLLEQGLSGRCL